MGGIIKPPQSPQTYIGNQVLINSDRLIFNAKKDNLLLFSDKSMGFSTNNSFHFDSDPFRGAFIVNAPHIYLGLELNKSLPYSPAVKGPVLYEILHDLMLIIKNMMGIIQYGLSYNVNLNTGHTAFTTAETSDAFKDIIEEKYQLKHADGWQNDANPNKGMGTVFGKDVPLPSRKDKQLEYVAAKAIERGERLVVIQQEEYLLQSDGTYKLYRREGPGYAPYTEEDLQQRGKHVFTKYELAKQLKYYAQYIDTDYKFKQGR